MNNQTRYLQTIDRLEKDAKAATIKADKVKGMAAENIYNRQADSFLAARDALLIVIRGY